MVKIFSGGQLTAEEMIRYSTFIRSQFRQSSNAYEQYERGLLDEQSLRDLTFTLNLLFVDLPDGGLNKSICENSKLRYPKGFVQFVDDFIVETTDD